MFHNHSTFSFICSVVAFFLYTTTFLSVCGPGLSNIIGIIVYISANAGDPNQSESKRSHWYGWSFYCGALSFIMAETVGALTVHLFIDSHRTHTFRQAPRNRMRASFQSSRSSSYRSRYRSHMHSLPRSPCTGRKSNDEVALRSLRYAPATPTTALTHAHYIKAENGLAFHAHSHSVQHEEEKCGVLPSLSSSATTRRTTPV